MTQMCWRSKGNGGISVCRAQQEHVKPGSPDWPKHCIDWWTSEKVRSSVIIYSGAETLHQSGFAWLLGSVDKTYWQEGQLLKLGSFPVSRSCSPSYLPSQPDLNPHLHLEPRFTSNKNLCGHFSAWYPDEKWAQEKTDLMPKWHESGLKPLFWHQWQLYKNMTHNIEAQGTLVMLT